METVHIKLTNERGVVVVLEQFRNKCLCELIFVKNNERVAAVRPANEFGVLAIVKETSNGQLHSYKGLCKAAYLFNFCTNGGICFRFDCASRLACAALSSNLSMLSFSAKLPSCAFESNPTSPAIAHSFGL